MENKFREIEFELGQRLIECIEELHSYNDKGLLVYGVFNGIKLYSTETI